MKLHITNEQLLELDDTTHDKLKDLAVKKGYWKHGAGAILNIGEMIEILDNDSGEDIDSYGERTINVHTIGRPWHHWLTIHWDQEYELCDALWEAVKEVLNAK